MNKKISKIKKKLAIILIFLFSINTFAAIVSDNDGSAFVTKAEFDALKKDFDKQVDDYNKSIDGKIDGAIAAYLSGLAVAKRQVEDLYFKDWKKVTACNYAFDNTYYPLNFTCSYTQNCATDVSVLSDAIGWHQTHFVTYDLVSKRKDTEYQRVNVCDAGNEVKATPSTVVWKGYARNYNDSLEISHVWKDDYYPAGGKGATEGRRVANWFDTVSVCKVYATHWGKIKPGYYANFTDKSNIQALWGGDYYVDGNSSYDYYVYHQGMNISSGVVKPTVTLEEVSGKQYDYEHIIHDATASIIMCDPDWVQHFTSNGSKTVTDLYNNLSNTGSSKTGYWAATETNVNGSGGMGYYKARTVTNGYYVSDYGKNEKQSTDYPYLPTIGLLGLYKSNKIYQVDTKPSKTVDKTTFEIDKPNLLNGFVCFAAKKNDRITWEPSFNNYQTISKSTGMVTSTDPYDVELVLSLEPFGPGLSVSDAKNILVTKTIPASEKTEKITFTMPSDKEGFVYCKWRPKESTVADDAFWIVDLDVSSCNTYIREVE